MHCMKKCIRCNSEYKTLEKLKPYGKRDDKYFYIFNTQKKDLNFLQAYFYFD